MPNSVTAALQLQALGDGVEFPGYPCYAFKVGDVVGYKAAKKVREALRVAAGSTWRASKPVRASAEAAGVVSRANLAPPSHATVRLTVLQTCASGNHAQGKAGTSRHDPPEHGV